MYISEDKKAIERRARRKARWDKRFAATSTTPDRETKRVEANKARTKRRSRKKVMPMI